MARKQSKAGDSASADVWTNTSQNPVILGDGSSVAPGAQTSPEQAEFVEGSFWEEHGVLVSGSPVLSEAGSRKAEELEAENETLRAQLFEVSAKVESLQTENEALKAKIPKAE
ncbi:hypothetical protein [Pseudomonas sp. Y24-6]|uniref:hypothetical protein n=1 Tax=Pseudomonas sp. Y24-6 TaxID=2750013 RepID=UPI001CE12145|nr:hypothetical protein [Pseudomonas sp. Y24-6]MCA4964903.1 hypothetical protein [Pseudomonas sp. Y24-6]